MLYAEVGFQQEKGSHLWRQRSRVDSLLLSCSIIFITGNCSCFDHFVSLTADNSYFRQRRIFEDDAYSFGFIILESFIGPSVASRREEFLLNEMVCSQDLV